MVAIRNGLKLVFPLCLLVLGLLARTPTSASYQTSNQTISIYLPIVVSAATAPELPPNATLLHVTAGGSHSPDCGSAADPCGSIQEAVNMPNLPGTTHKVIKLGQGTYTGQGLAVVSIDGPQDAVTIIGGYSSSNWDAPALDPRNTIIDGQNARRGIFVRATFAEVRVEGVTVQNGLLTDGLLYDENDFYFGAGLSCSHSSVRLNKVIFKNNIIRRSVGSETVGGAGAGLYFNCPGSLQDVVFDSNEARGGNAPDNQRGAVAQGGGLLASEGSPITGTNLTFLNNKAIAGSGGVGQDGIGGRADALGGGASLQLDDVVLTGITAIGNQVVAGAGSSFGGFGDGGGLFFEFSTAQVRNGLFRNNIVTSGASPTGNGGSGGGGAIMAIDSALILDALTMVANETYGGAGVDGGDSGGGAMYFTDGNPNRDPMRVTGTNLVMANNRSEAGAGNNRYGGGGAIFNQDAELTLSHVTISSNSVLSTMFAPGIVTLNSRGSSTLTLTYSIIANHTTPSTPYAVVALGRGDRLILDHNMFYGNTGSYGTGFGGSSITSTNEVTPGNPLFVSPNAPNYDYHIRAGSAAQDQAFGSALTVDINGDSRPFGNEADLGADEYIQ